jgi:hypothetical protein
VRNIEDQPLVAAIASPITPAVVAAPPTPNPDASAPAPNFVIVALADASQPAQVQKVPATVSFAAEHPDRVRYASDTLADVAASSLGQGMY